MEETVETIEGSKKEEAHFSNSSVTTFLKCPRMYYLKYIKGYESKRKSVNLFFGDSVHKIFKHIYLNEIDATTNIINQYTYIDPKEIRTQGKLRKMRDAYVAQKLPVPWDKTLAVEDLIEFRVGPYLFVVIPDAVVEWNGGIYGIEHKTMTSLRDNFFKSFGRDSQIDAQMLGIKEKYGRCDGVYVNAVICRKGGPKAKTEEVEFLMDLVTRTEADLEKSRRYFEEHINDLSCRAHDLTDAEWPENRTSCFDYNDSCIFCPLCNDKLDNPDDYYGRREVH